MSGHLFVLRGDLTQLRCSAILVPCDTDWNVVWKHWGSLLPEDRFDPADEDGWRPLKGGGTGCYTDVDTDGPRWVHLVVTADDYRPDTPQGTACSIADGVVDTIADLAKRDLPSVAGRVKPLIGLPLVGTGDGGFETMRGVLIHELVPRLRDAAREHDVDVALVLIDQRDHAAVQAVRSECWEGFAEEEPDIAQHIDIADNLGSLAAQGELSLFLGSGVSVPLGIPDWRKLLSDISPGGIDLQNGTPQEIAQRIENVIGRPELEARIRAAVKVDGVAPSHLLLAALSAIQNVTTNYDIAYERALDMTVTGRKYSVLTRQLAVQPEPWLLKYHGCVNRPKSIVITSNDYKKLKRRHGALQAVVESLMLTSHLMFVGFSMDDEDFNDAARKVQAVRKLAEDRDSSTVATVLALHPGAVSEHAGFHIVSMLDQPHSIKNAARLLEIFLDRVSWKAATTGPAANSYLLHPDYEDLFAKDSATTSLRGHLLRLVEEMKADRNLRSGKGWDQVVGLLTRLGAGTESLAQIPDAKTRRPLWKHPRSVEEELTDGALATWD